MPQITLKEILEISKEATRNERERCIKLVGRYLTGDIQTQSELLELMESGVEA